MRPDPVVRRCADRDLTGLEADEPPGSGIARYFLREQAAGNIAYAAAWRDQQLLGTVVLDFRSDYAPELKHLYVQEVSRGAGAGTAMCRWTERHAMREGFDKLYLGVGVDNPEPAGSINDWALPLRDGRPQRRISTSTRTGASNGPLK